MLKIGVFDSGVGGITVLTELRKRYPFADFVYLGDTAHVPYGTRSRSQVEKLSLSCARTLKTKKIDLLVVACNTASSLALDAIRAEMDPIPVYGVVEPGAKAALLAAKAFSATSSPENPPCILVLATRATVRSQAYRKALSQWKGEIFEQPCPLLVPMIEEGWLDHKILHATISEYVSPYLNRPGKGIALLGCTHYPWIYSAFEKKLEGWIVVNSAASVADLLQKSPQIAPFLKHSAPSNASVVFSSHQSKVEWIFTDPDAVPSFAKQWCEV